MAWAFLALLFWHATGLNGMVHAFLRPFTRLAHNNIRPPSPTGQSEAFEDIESLRLLAAARQLKQLETDLGLRPSSDWQVTAAAVSGRDPLAWDSSFRINKGKADNIQTGSAVMAAGVVVGTVASATRHSAVVRTLLAPESTLGIKLQKTGGVGILKGRHAERTLCLADYLDRDLNYQIGELALTSGLGEIIPGGLPVGKVSSWEKDTVANIVDMSYAQLHIRTPTIRKDIRYVWVVARQSPQQAENSIMEPVQVE